MSGNEMIAQSVADLAREMDLNGRGPFSNRTFNEIHQRLSFFKKSHYDQYIPTFGSESKDFEARLLDWLLNFDDDEVQRLLLELAPNIAFLTREDFTKLHQAAFRGPISQWIVDELNLSFDNANISTDIAHELQEYTWFTSITDSMQISDFHHANRISGIDLRPDWRSLSELGDPLKIRSFMNTHTALTIPRPIRRIVILEDFVGTGTQMSMGSGSVDFAAKHFPDYPIFLCPLIICPEGDSMAKSLASHHSNLTYEPVLRITEDQLINPIRSLDPGGFEEAIRDVCKRLYPEVSGAVTGSLRPYSPWGFGQTGCLVVFYSNTPANTLPLIHHDSNAWNSLFHRSARIQ